MAEKGFVRQKSVFRIIYRSKYTELNTQRQISGGSVWSIGYKLEEIFPLVQSLAYFVP